MKKVLIINPILYTNEQKIVRKINSIKDCMIIDLCNAFVDMGYDTTLVAAEDYKPITDEQYKFNVVWLRSYFKRIFTPNKIPCNLGLRRYLKNNKYDLIISSEVFSIDTFIAVKSNKSNLIIWQEMAFHQKMAKQMASKFWHNVIVKLFYRNIRIVPRTDNAKKFISQYCSNVSDQVIQHGINLDKFNACLDKNETFIVSSQLIERKQIHKIITEFADFKKYNSNNYKLIVAGDGDQKNKLIALCKDLKVDDSVLFMGKLPHKDLVKYLSKAKAMLIYTKKDNSMISIAESIAVCTPVITTSVPDNSIVVQDNKIGIVDDQWNWESLKYIVDNNDEFVNNCYMYRSNLDNKYNVKQFIKEIS